MQQFLSHIRTAITTTATAIIATAALSTFLLLTGCGHSGPTIGDMQALLEREVAAQGGLFAGFGLDYSSVRVTSLACSPAPNDVFNCLVTLTGAAGQNTISTQVAQINGVWSEVE